MPKLGQLAQAGTKRMVGKDGLDGIGDIFDLIGDPASIGLIDWGNLPDWDLPGNGGTPGAPGIPWTGEGDTTDPTTGLPAPGPGSPGDPGSATGPGGLPAWLTNLGPQILRMLGLGGGTGAGGAGGGAGGAGGLMNLLAMIAGGAGGFGAYNATQEGRQAMLDSNTRAEEFVRGQLGAGDERMRPYTDIGREAVWNLNAMGPSPLAGRYQPLNTGRGIKLGQLAKGR